ncbi:MAG TPA: outer membrane protein assembly factor BamA [Steroidobacteraceae bacterium]|nr:outer membrane protein assembly factor BamA [Steroidobacteraceae bacterium]
MHLRSLIHAALILAAGETALAQTAPVATPADMARDQEFTVGDIQVEGLQRISEGTLYNYLPVNIGDRLTRQKQAEAIRALFATGFFRDVELRRDGGTLIVAVKERPTIESFEIKGNKDIKTEDMTDSLRNVGLAAGKILNQSTLDDVKQYLTDQYFARGKYNVRINAKVEDLQNNRVKVTVDIKEGKRSKIRQINLVGNTSFDASDILDTFELKTPHLTSFIKSDDRYSRETLQGDLEKLKSFYMDRGYANFTVDSTQVAIAPDKEDMFITINMTEGDVFKFGDIKLAGTLKVPENQLRGLIDSVIKPGTTYSRKQVTAVQEAITQRLGLDGYAFAKVDPVPTTDNATHVVGITFLVEPGNRVYVRRVNYTGTTSVNDDVFRRETRQLEGGFLSNALLDRSKQLIQRLPFVDKVDSTTTPVAGTSDLVDVDFKIKEGLPGQFNGGITWSETYRFGLQASIVHTNFMGTGDRIALDADANTYSKSFAFSLTDPYATVNGVSRTVSVSYRDIKQFTSYTSAFSTKMLSAGVVYGYPITEYQSVRAGLSAQRSDLLASPFSSGMESIDWVRNNGGSYAHYTYSGTPVLVSAVYGSRFNTYPITLGWGYDSLNRALFADRGMRHQISMQYTLPFSGIQYLTAGYNGLQLVPLSKWFVLMFNCNINYSRAVGGTTSSPPFLNNYAGGPNSVRGYSESELGPRDSNGLPYGGNLLTSLQTELLLPIPDKWKNSARFSLFYDIGNVFTTENVKFLGRDLQTPVDYKFDFSKLKRSVGVAVQWLAPMGIFRFSYALPLNASDGDAVHYPDQKEEFQFTVGQAF